MRSDRFQDVMNAIERRLLAQPFEAEVRLCVTRAPTITGAVLTVTDDDAAEAVMSVELEDDELTAARLAAEGSGVVQ
jgi:hypothetical protein